MKLFQWVKEIRSKNGVLHFKRYAILETSYFSVYWHKIYEHDRDIHMHSHPWAFFGIIVKGSYVEQYVKKEPVGDGFWPIGISLSTAYRTKGPLSIGFGSRKYFHRILNIPPFDEGWSVRRKPQLLVKVSVMQQGSYSYVEQSKMF